MSYICIIFAIRKVKVYKVKLMFLFYTLQMKGYTIHSFNEAQPMNSPAPKPNIRSLFDKSTNFFTGYMEPALVL